ncbi:MAG: protein kinase [Lentisphaeria bacterium]|nr:protein kinase [Lentisphaeria bacterium]
MTLGAYCGGGAYGEVYVCTDVSGRKLAVKIISKQKLGDDWERELRGVSNYRKITENAPGLLQIYHVAEDADTFFYTMEAADSVTPEKYRADTLAERLKKGPLPTAETYRILRAIFDGIKTIHDAGFAHRDIKPDNIIFVKGQPKLSDIGLLSSLSATYTQLAGTLDFLPPEERSSSSGTDRKSRQKNDLYAFGKVIYCSVTGRSPQDFPAVPAELPLTPELKFFLRLAFRLCNKDPLLRLDSLEKTGAELIQIERKLLYGETWRDKLGYGFQCAWLTFSAGLAGFVAWSRKHWIFMGLALVVLSPLIWLALPERKFDITKVKNKKYIYRDGKLSMTIPFQWIVLTEKTFRDWIKRLPDTKSDLKLSDAQRDLIFKTVPPGTEFIAAGYRGKFLCNLLITGVQLPETDGSLEQELAELRDDEIKMMMKETLTREHQFPIEIYTITRGKVNGRPYIEVDYAFTGLCRVCRRLVPLRNRLYTIQFTMPAEDSEKYRKQFDSIIATLKIEE